MLVRRNLPALPVLPSLRNLMEWDPFREIAPVVEVGPELKFAPCFDLKETNEAYVFNADLPGIAEKDIDISLSGNRLTVSGKREEEKEEKDERYYTCERSYGAFTRSFTLPEGIDPEHVEAELKGGVLTIVAPKKPELRPHKISVKGVIEKVKGALGKEETKAKA